MLYSRCAGWTMAQRSPCWRRFCFCASSPAENCGRCQHGGYSAPLGSSVAYLCQHSTRCARLRPQSHYLECATCPCHHRAALAQFRHKHRPLAKAVDYAEIFIYDEAQQEAALSDIAILGVLSRKCLLLRLGVFFSGPQAAPGLGGSPKKFAPCVMGSPSASSSCAAH